MTRDAEGGETTQPVRNAKQDPPHPIEVGPHDARDRMGESRRGRSSCRPIDRPGHLHLRFARMGSTQ